MSHPPAFALLVRLVLALTLLVPTAPAWSLGEVSQQLASEAPSIVGESFADGFGSSVIPYPDLDGDGVPELLVGAPFASDSGALWLVPGAALLEGGESVEEVALSRLTAPEAHRLGSSSFLSPDVDGDGLPEIVAGDPSAFEGAGALHLFGSRSLAEADAEAALTVAGPYPGARLGAAVSVLEAGFGSWPTVAVLLHGTGEVPDRVAAVDALTLFSAGGQWPADSVRSLDCFDASDGSLRALPDQDGDGREELLVALPRVEGPDLSGLAMVLSGEDLRGESPLTVDSAWSVLVEPLADALGATAMVFDDMVILGDESSPATLYVYPTAGLGAGPEPIGFTIAGGEKVPALRGMIRVDPEGRAVAALAVPGSDDLAGEVVLLADGEHETLSHGVVGTLVGVPGDLLGAALASADLDGDGISDLIIGAPGSDSVLFHRNPEAPIRQGDTGADGEAPGDFDPHAPGEDDDPHGHPGDEPGEHGYHPGAPSMEDGPAWTSPWAQPGRPVTRTTSSPTSPTGIPIAALTDGAAGDEQVRDGVFVHEIPLAVPAGRGDLGPQLSVSFAQGASQWLGRHWRLGGFPTITRKSAGGGAATGGPHDTFWYGGEKLVEFQDGDPNSRTFRRERADGERFRLDTGGGTHWEVTQSGLTRIFESQTVLRARPRRADLSPGSVRREWHLTTATDATGNAVEYAYLVDNSQVRPDTITWADADFQLQFAWHERADAGLRSLASGRHAWIEVDYAPLLDAITVVGPEGDRVERWRFDYETAVPSAQARLAALWQDGASAEGDTEPLRLRRFHYENSFGDPLPGVAPDTPITELWPDLLSMNQTPDWGPAEELELPAPSWMSDWEAFYAQAGPIIRIARLNHDALPDVLALHVDNAWLVNAGDRPFCADSCDDLGCPEAEGSACLLTGSAACRQPITAVAYINHGDDPNLGGLGFTEDPLASAVINKFIRASMTGEAGWQQVLANVRLADMNNDGMDDLLLYGATRLSPLTAGWEARWDDAVAALAQSQSMTVTGPDSVPSSIHVDLDGDGHLDTLLPPEPEMHAMGPDLLDQIWTIWEQQSDTPFMVSQAEWEASLPGGLCVTPPPKAADGAPRWTVYWGGPGLAGSGTLELPFYGGPLTGRLGGPGMDAPVGGDAEYPTSWMNSSTPVVSTGPGDGGCVVPDGHGGLQEGYWVSGSQLAGTDSTFESLSAAPTGWSWINRGFQFRDLNGDSCADITVGLETGPLVTKPAMRPEIAVDLDDLEQYQATLLGSGGGEHEYGVYTDVFFGDCTGRFVAAREHDGYQTGWGPEPPLGDRHGLGTPFTRYRQRSGRPVNCHSLPFSGLELNVSPAYCADPHVNQPWIFNGCFPPDDALDDICESPACSSLLAACGTPLTASISSSNWGPDVEPYFPGSGGGDEYPAPLFNGDEAFDPLLEQLFDAGKQDKPWGVTTTPVNGSQWSDLDGDGVPEWISLCQPDANTPDPADPSAISAPDGGPQAGDGSPLPDYMLAVHHPTHLDHFGVVSDASCEERAATGLDIDWLGMIKEDPGGPAYPFPGWNDASMLLDLDGSGFVDHVVVSGDTLIVRRNERIVPEGALIAITYPGGVEAGSYIGHTGTSYLFWDHGDPIDHPLLPRPELGIAGIVDSNGYRVWERRGCRAGEWRETLGCALVLGETHRGALTKAAYVTTPELKGFRWLEARYEPDGRLDALRFDLPAAASMEPLPEPAPLPAPDEWTPVAQDADGPLAPWDQPPPIFDAEDLPAPRPQWRTCRIETPPGSFDGSLMDYLAECAWHASGLDGQTAYVPDLSAALFQQVSSFPHYDGTLSIHPEWAGGQPLALAASAAAFTMQVDEAQADPVHGAPLEFLAAGFAHTPDDDVRTSAAYDDGGPHGPKLVERALFAAGSLLETRSWTWDDWMVTDQTWTNAAGDKRTEAYELDGFGQIARVNGFDGVWSAHTYDVCGQLAFLDTNDDPAVAPAPWTSTTHNGACRQIEQSNSEGLTTTNVVDGRGQSRLTTTQPRADQAPALGWALTDLSPGGPRQTRTDGETLTRSYTDDRGRVVQTVRCALASTLPIAAAAVLALTPADFACVDDTEVQSLTLWSDDGLVLAQSAPHLEGDAPVRWTRHEYDAFRRLVASEEALVSSGDPLDPSAPTAGRRETVYLHDGRREIDAAGLVTESTLAPLNRQLHVDGVLVADETLTPDGRPVLLEDPFGVTEVQYDGWLRPVLRIEPTFEGVSAGGGIGPQTPTWATAWDDSDRPICTTDAAGYATCFTYDPFGQHIETTRDGDVVATVAPVPPLSAAMVATGNPSLVRARVEADGTGASTTVLVDGGGRMVQTIFPDGAVESQSWDALGRLASRTDEAGRTTQWTFELLPGGFRKTSITQPDGGTSLLFADLEGRTVRAVDADGVAVDYEYDGFGRAVRTWRGADDPDTLTTLYSGLLQLEHVYDDAHHLVQTCPGGTTSANECTELTYDSLSRIVAWSRGDQAWSLQYDDAGLLQSETLLTPGHTRVVTYEYDGVGNLQQRLVNSVGSGITRFDVMGRAARFDPTALDLGAAWLEFDAHGRVSADHRPERALPVTYDYDAAGRLVWSEDGDGIGEASISEVADVWIDRDERGRPIAETDTFGMTLHRAWVDDRVASLRVESPTGEIVSRVDFDHDVMGRVVARRAAIDSSCARAAELTTLQVACAPEQYTQTETEWSSAGSRTAVEDGLENRTEWSYDDATGWLVQESSAISTTVWSRDELGRPGLVEAGDLEITFDYDAAGRLEHRAWLQGSESEEEEHLFDELGRPIWSQVRRNGAPVETLHREFDAWDRELRRYQELGSAGTPPTWPNPTCDAGELCVDYDAMGRLSSVVWPDTRQVLPSWADGGLDAVEEVGPGGGLLYEVTDRDELGRPVAIWRAGDVYEDLIRDDLGRVTDRLVTLPDGWLNEQTGFESEGRLAFRIVDVGGATPPEGADEAFAYGYTASGWLESAVNSETELQIDYDRVGNRVQRTDLTDGTGWQATYAPGNQLTTVASLDGAWGASFTYDALGRREQTAEGSAVAHSPRGRIETVWGDTGPFAEFTYGVDGRRVGETSASGTRSFQYGVAGWLPWAVSGPTGNRDLLAPGLNAIVTLEPTGEAVAAFDSVLGSPMLQVDDAGEAVWTGTFDPWGAPTHASGDAPVADFAGMLGNLAGLPLLSAGRRDYDALSGTWMQPDPLGVDGDISLYRYAEGDPVNRVDPSGLCADSSWVLDLEPSRFPFGSPPVPGFGSSPSQDWSWLSEMVAPMTFDGGFPSVPGPPDPTDPFEPKWQPVTQEAPQYKKKTVIDFDPWNVTATVGDDSIPNPFETDRNPGTPIGPLGSGPNYFPDPEETELWDPFQEGPEAEVTDHHHPATEETVRSTEQITRMSLGDNLQLFGSWGIDAGYESLALSFGPGMFWLTDWFGDEYVDGVVTALEDASNLQEDLKDEWRKFKFSVELGLALRGGLPVDDIAGLFKKSRRGGPGAPKAKDSVDRVDQQAAGHADASGPRTPPKDQPDGPGLEGMQPRATVADDVPPKADATPKASTGQEGLPKGVGGTGKNYDKVDGQGLYVLVEPDAGIVRYVGRGDAPARTARHATTDGKSHLEAVILWDNSLPTAQAKGLEQSLMDHFGGARRQNPDTPLLNEFRGYAPTNPNAGDYSAAATEGLVQATLNRLTVSLNR